MTDKNTIELPPLALGKYIHSKTGNEYEVIGVGLHTETNEPMVVYRPLYDSAYTLFVRPYGMFREIVTINGSEEPRFKRLNHESNSISVSEGR